MRIAPARRTTREPGRRAAQPTRATSRRGSAAARFAFRSSLFGAPRQSRVVGRELKVGHAPGMAFGMRASHTFNYSPAALT